MVSIFSKVKKLWKQVREWKQVKDGVRGLLHVEQKLILRHLLSLF